MATYYVRTSSAGGDGTADADSGSTAAYASLSAWEDARDGNLTGTGVMTVIVSCGSGTTADTTAVTISGWTTTASDYIKIQQATADAHGGIWSDSKYRLTVANNQGINNSADYLWIDGLQIKLTSLNADYQACITNTSVSGANNLLRVSHCILRTTSTSYRTDGIKCNASNQVVVIWNCIVYEPGTSTSVYAAAVYCGATTSVSVYGCTLIGAGAGLRREAGTVIAKNCYAHSVNGVNAGYGGTLTLTTCAASDATGSSAELDNVAYSTDNFESVTPGESTYLKVKSTGALYGAGTTLSDDPPGSTALGVDIAGNARS